MCTETVPDISVVIVSWNVRELLAHCLDSFISVAEAVVDGWQRQGVLGGRTIDFWVVDNASGDGTVAMLAERYDWVHLLAAERNLGFTAGNNLALRQCRGRFVLLLNPDTILQRAAEQPDPLSLMADLLDREGDIGMIGPRLVYGNGTPQSSRRRFPTLLMGLMESTLGERWFPRNRWARRYRMADVPDDQVQDVDWVTGACMLVRREALDQVGLFDESFFMYSEELDLCKRLRAAGWRVVYLPQATVVHYEGQSSGQVVARRQLLFDTSKVRYFGKHVGPASAELLRLCLLGGYAIELLLETAKWLLGHKPALRRARVRAYRDIIRTGLRSTENKAR